MAHTAMGGEFSPASHVAWPLGLSCGFHPASACGPPAGMGSWGLPRRWLTQESPEAAAAGAHSPGGGRPTLHTPLNSGPSFLQQTHAPANTRCCSHTIPQLLQAVSMHSAPVFSPGLPLSGFELHFSGS